jgi:Flp pilus assembly pilin Flp
MMNLIKSFIKEEDGMGTVEIILIIAVLVGIALIFRKTIIEFVNNMIGKIFPDTGSIDTNNKIPSPTLNTGN